MYCSKVKHESILNNLANASAKASIKQYDCKNVKFILDNPSTWLNDAAFIMYSQYRRVFR